MGWFPLCRALMEDNQAFREILTHSEKLYFLWLISEFNRRGQFYKSDREMFTQWCNWLKPRTITRARGKLIDLGWIHVTHGTITNDNRLATEYNMVKWAVTKHINQDSDGPYATINREAFNSICSAQIRPADIIVIVYLLYYKGRYSNNDSFHIHKAELSRLANVSKAHNRVERIRQELDTLLLSGRGAPMFSVENHHHELHFAGWRDFIELVLEAEPPL
jgi:hypothetical protein